MQNDKSKFKIWIIFIFSFLFLSKPTFAVCPLCTVAVGAGVGLCRYLGIDDTISGVWIGGLIVSAALWLADFLRKKRILKSKTAEILSLIFFYLLTLPFLSWLKIIGWPGNSLWGMDKIVLGILSGSLVFLLAVFTDRFLRRLNKGKILFYYQKVVIPLLFLALLSLIFYKITC